MKNIGKDFKEKIDQKWLDGEAENHLEVWEDRFRGKNWTKDDFKFDLEMNHDPSLQIEWAEEKLERKLTSEEYDLLVDLFNKAVVKKYKKIPSW